MCRDSNGHTIYRHVILNSRAMKMYSRLTLEQCKVYEGAAFSLLKSRLHPHYSNKYTVHTQTANTGHVSSPVCTDREYTCREHGSLNHASERASGDTWRVKTN